MTTRLTRLFAPLMGNPRRLWIRYLVAVGLVIALLTGSHVSYNRSIERAALDAEVINVAGRQRMLSQRIIYLAQRDHMLGSEATAEALEAAIDLMAFSHGWLIGLPDMPEATRRHLGLTEGTEGLDQHVRDYLAVAKIILAEPQLSLRGQEALTRLIEMGDPGLLRDLDHAVTLLAQDANDRAAGLSRVATLALWLAIAVLVLESLVIYLPAQMSVNRTLDALEDKSEALASRNDELAARNAALDHAAHHDALTGLANRKLFFAELEAALALWREGQVQVCLIGVDLDRFKPINDTHGHPTGDAVLVEVARRMNAVMRERDLVARVGGDEFLIVAKLRQTDGIGYVASLADNLRAALHEPFWHEGVELRIGASVGLSLADEAAATPDALVARTDAALYEAKHSGRGVVRIWAPEPREIGGPEGDLQPA